MGLRWTPSSKPTSVLYWGSQHWTQHPSCVPPVLNREAGPPPSTCCPRSGAGGCPYHKGTSSKTLCHGNILFVWANHHTIMTPFLTQRNFQDHKPLKTHSSSYLINTANYTIIMCLSYWNLRITSLIRFFFSLHSPHVNNFSDRVQIWGISWCVFANFIICFLSACCILMCFITFSHYEEFKCWIS